MPGYIISRASDQREDPAVLANIPATQTVIEIKAPGGPEMLVPATRLVPEPKAGEVLIRIAAAGVNRADCLQRMGRYPMPPGAPDIPGLECSGTVVKVGEGVAERRVGDEVCALMIGDGYGEYATVPAVQCLPVPQGVSLIVGGDYIPRQLDLLAHEGRLCFVALMGGSRVETDFGLIQRKHLTVTGSTLRSRNVEQKAAIITALKQKVWPLWAAGKLRPFTYRQFPLAEAADAHRLMESSTHIGKILLIPQ